MGYPELNDEEKFLCLIGMRVKAIREYIDRNKLPSQAHFIQIARDRIEQWMNSEEGQGSNALFCPACGWKLVYQLSPGEAVVNGLCDDWEHVELRFKICTACKSSQLEYYGFNLTEELFGEDEEEFRV